MRILHVKGKMGRWFEFTSVDRINNVTVQQAAIVAVEADGKGRSILTLGNKLVYVLESYEEIIKALTLEERD